jgi:hypothetical protein
MDKNKLIVLIIFGILLISIFSLVSADMPEVHNYLDHQAINLAPSSPVALSITNYYEEFLFGDIITDLSVFYYFSGGFSSISKEYKATHSYSYCARALELASNNEERAIAYGMCSHLTTDCQSHNFFVSSVVKKTGGVNGLIHIFAEQKVKNELSTPELTQEVRSALSNQATKHKAFVLKVLRGQEGLDGVPVEEMYDLFVAEVSANNDYSVGYRGFTAVPFSIHLILVFFFLANMTILAFLIRRKKKNKFNYISMGILTFLALMVVLIYILFFTGTIWQVFQVVSRPVTWVLPTSGWEQSISQAIQSKVNFFNQGIVYISTLKDPAGSESLKLADQSGTFIRIFIDFLLVSIISLFIWLNFRKKRN